MKDFYIRVATPDDAEQILNIYAPYVKNTAVSFEYEVPGLEEFKSRIVNTIKRYPYLVAVSGEEIIGYSYTGAFKSREAYSRAVETTVYIREDKKRINAGKSLYEVLEAISKAQNITNMNAGIAYTDTADEYLSADSLHFHESMGYSPVGRFHKCGYKFGRWYDLIWAEKTIASHEDNPPAFIPFNELDISMLQKAGVSIAPDRET